MAYDWPAGTEFQVVRLNVLDRECRGCGDDTQVKDYKRRRLFGLGGPLKVVSQMTQCTNKGCPGAEHLTVAEEEILIAPPWWVLGWDVFTLIGQRRFAKNRSVPDIREELAEELSITLSEDAIEDYVARYQAILAARQNDPARLRAEYAKVENLVLTIDGLKPEKGHETLYTVRELNAKRVWFAVPLLSASEDEVRTRLFEKAKEWVDRLGKPVRAWMSDKEDAFVSGVKAVFPGVPHRLCQNHFLRDAAEKVLEQDSHAKVQMRTKVRGLRKVERSILEKRHGQSAKATTDTPEDVVLEYCAAIRGILNKNQGGPLDPPGLRMATSLKEVRASIERSLDTGLSGDIARALRQLTGCIDRGIDPVSEALDATPGYVATLREMRDTLSPEKGKARARKRHFQRIRRKLERSKDPIELSIAGVMSRFEEGLFVGGQNVQGLQDNMDLERWFRIPKAHLRHVHGRQHAGFRVVVEGPSLLLALDAHHKHRRPFQEHELRPYLGVELSPEQLDAVERRKIMRRACSRESLPDLLTELERRLRPKARAKLPRGSRRRPHESVGS